MLLMLLLVGFGKWGWKGCFTLQVFWRGEPWTVLVIWIWFFILRHFNMSASRFNFLLFSLGFLQSFVIGAKALSKLIFNLYLLTWRNQRHLYYMIWWTNKGGASGALHFFHMRSLLTYVGHIMANYVSQ